MKQKTVISMINETPLVVEFDTEKDEKIANKYYAHKYTRGDISGVVYYRQIGTLHSISKSTLLSKMLDVNELTDYGKIILSKYTED